MSLAVLSTLGVFGSVQAQDQLAMAPDVLVTANRFEQSLAEVPGDVTVIDRKEIEKSGANNLTDIFSRIPGFQLANNGGPRQNTSLYVRGHQVKHMLVLVDGRRLGAFDGFTNAQIQNFPVNQIERIEVLRGPASSLYGSDAIAGLVQIITRKPEGDDFDVAVQVGSNQRYGLDLFKSVKFGDSVLSIGAGYEESEGFSTLRDTSEKDGFDSDYVNLGFKTDLTKRLSLSLDAAMVNSTVEFDDPGFPGFSPVTEEGIETDTDLQNIGGSLNMVWNETHQTRFSVGQTQENRESRSGFSSVNEYEQFQADVEHRINLSAGQLLLGVGHLRQDFNSTFQQFPTLTETTSDSLTAAYFGRAGKASYQASVRQDFYSDVKDEATGQLGVTYHITDNFRMGGSAGTGFRRPTPSEIIGFFTPGSVNPDLKPESSVNYELFVAGDVQQVTWRATVYQSQVEDLLVFNGATSGYSNQPGESEFNGLSLSLSGQAAGLDLSASLDTTSAKTADGQRLGRVALHKLNLSASKTIGRWTTYAEWELVGDRLDSTPSQFNPSPNRLGGYGLVNLNVIWKLNQKQSFSLRVDNLFGKDYEIAQGYNVPKSDFLITYRHKF